MPAPLHADESKRLAVIERLGAATQEENVSANDIARLASLSCDTPVGLASVIHDERQMFIGNFGFYADNLLRDHAFCAYTILEDDIMVVRDALQDLRFRTNPLVTGPQGIRFYAGIKACAPDGAPLGTVCVYAREPRGLDERQAEALRALGRQAERLFALQLALADANHALDSMGSAGQHGLNAASDILLNPMAAMTLQLANLRHRNPAEADHIAKVEANLRRVTEAVQSTLNDTFRQPA